MEKIVKCLISSKSGKEAEVHKAISNFFVLRGLPAPEIKKGGAGFQLELSEKNAEWLSVVLDTSIPDLLAEPSNKMTNLDGYGKVKFMPSGGIIPPKGLKMDAGRQL